MADKIYNHYDAAKDYDRLLFRADKTLQSAELNELQSLAQARLRGIADVLFAEGDIVRGCQCIADLETEAGEAAITLEPGALYVSGAVRGVGPGALVVPAVGPVTVGVYLRSETVTEIEDPSLINPAVGTLGYHEAGAARERIVLVWGAQGQPPEGCAAADYYPVWNLIDGNVLPKEPPPNIDAVTQAIARYDRDSAGGTYVVAGLDVTQGADLPSGEQVYTIREGAARINGNPIQLAASRRVVYDARPDLQWVDSEPHVSATEGAQRIAFDRAPLVGQPQVRLQARKTVTVIHGGFSGAADPLPDTAVLLIDRIVQGDTVYEPGTDYALTAGQIDWKPGGAQPAPGSSYTVTYQYILNAAPTGVDATGCTVTGALPGTLVLISYHYALRRYDRLLMDGAGVTQWVTGVPAPWNPAPPATPAGSLLLATIYQSWDANRRVTLDAIRVVPMQTLNQYREWIYQIYGDLAELRLYVDAQGRHSGVKKGLFADPMLDNDLRDAGVPQTGAIGGGWLQLPLDVTLTQIGTDIHQPQTTPYEAVAIITQPARTGSMLVNPYQSFAPLPTWATLTPAVDYWTETDEQWANPLTVNTAGNRFLNTTISEKIISETTAQLAWLRPIEVQFAAGFAAGDTLHAVTFDGISVAAQPLAGESLVADGQSLRGRFTIPEGVPAGAKAVRITANSGHYADALFIGQGQLLTQVHQQTITNNYYSVDPLAQTFTLDASAEVCGVDLWFTATGADPVQVQIREVESGVPGRAIVAQAQLAAASISTGAYTRINWPPVLMQGGREYAIVILTNDPTTAVAVADLGAWDEAGGAWVSAQPYQVGVLLSSSNASTWTAHQTRDLTFTLLAARHTAPDRVLELGTVPVQDATDLMALAGCVTPAAGSSVTFALALDDGSIFNLAAGQPVQTAARYTGGVRVSARITGGEQLAAQLLPGMQLLAGSVQAAGDYVSPAITARGGTQLTAVIEALLPAGSALTVQARDAALPADSDAGWAEVPFLSSSPQTAGVLELTYHVELAAAGISADQVRIRARITGNHAARPLATNLRAYVI